MPAFSGNVEDYARFHQEARKAFISGRITRSEYTALLLGDMDLDSHGLFNIQHKDTPVPWGTYQKLYPNRAAQVRIDKLLGLW